MEQARKENINKQNSTVLPKSDTSDDKSINTRDELAKLAKVCSGTMARYKYVINN